jgi:hypothetical protein
VRGLLVPFAFLSVVTVAQAQPAAAPAPTAPAAQFVRAHYSVTTQVPEAQEAFDEGLTLLYAFNPQEARRAFARAAAADGRLGMAYWGEATSYGININTTYDPASQRQGHDAILKATAREAGASATERALIDAAARRFAYFGKDDGDASARAYADAMRAAAAAHPDDNDLVTLAAEAEMDLHPWGYWHEDGKPEAGTLEIIRLLEGVLARDPAHIGANHLLIHAFEASPRPGDALDAANRLAADAFGPAAEHLTHMPAHTFMRTGDYDAAAVANVRALDAFDADLAGAHAPGHESYYGHDCLFAVDAFMMAGEHANATKAAARCHEAAGRYAGDVAVRFGRWSDLGRVAGESEFFHGMAAAAGGRLDEALGAARTLDAQKRDTATIAADVIRAKVHALRGEGDLQIASLQKAVREQDALGYSEPPTWFFPVRESLGAAQFREHHFADAERTFRDDLVKNPRNPRSLFGLAATLEAEGRTADAAAARRAFDAAWQHADVQLNMADL